MQDMIQINMGKFPKDSTKLFCLLKNRRERGKFNLTKVVAPHEFNKFLGNFPEVDFLPQPIRFEDSGGLGGTSPKGKFS